MPSVETRDALEVATMRRVTLRLLPFLMLCYFISFLDRVNAGFAALQMNKAIGLSHAAFGVGGGLFYVSYVVFEIPSNLALEKVGARLWIARIMITWVRALARKACTASNEIRHPTSSISIRDRAGSQALAGCACTPSFSIRAAPAGSSSPFPPPAAVASGAEPLLIIAAIAGG